MTANDAALPLANGLPYAMGAATAAPSRDGFYNDKVVLQFSIATIVWGIVGMAVGVLIAAQLYWPTLGEGIPWLSYGRLRPLHTNAVIFAFGGSALFEIGRASCRERGGVWGDGGARTEEGGRQA